MSDSPPPLCGGFKLTKFKKLQEALWDVKLIYKSSLEQFSNYGPFIKT